MMKPRTSDVVREEMLTLYEEWFARVGPDRGDFFEEVLAPDWVYIDYNGIERGKADYEPYIAGVPPGSAPRSPRDLRVRLVGDVAIVDGSYAIPAAEGADGETETVIRFTAVWVDRDGSWVALAHHTSAVST